MGVDTVDFSVHSDMAKRVKGLVLDGLDVAIDAATFHDNCQLANYEPTLSSNNLMRY